MVDQYESEMIWLANGSPSEAEKLKRGTMTDYFNVLKYKVDEIVRQKPQEQHSDG